MIAIINLSENVGVFCERNGGFLCGSLSFIFVATVSNKMQNSKGGRPSTVGGWAHWLECCEHSSDG